jgi:hypothetical protein
VFANLAIIEGLGVVARLMDEGQEEYVRMAGESDLQDVLADLLGNEDQRIVRAVEALLTAYFTKQMT